jgi:AraC-like DNA-binding protein
MQTRLIADTIGELTFSWQLPPFLAVYTLPGHVPSVAAASFGHVIWQEIPCNGITIRMQHYLLNHGCRFTCIEEKPVLKLQMQVTNHVQYHLEGLGNNIFYEHGYNLLYMPHPQSQLHFPSEGIYSSLEICYPENSLLKLQSSFPLMSHFLKRVQRQEPAMLMPVNQISTRSLLDLINQLLLVMQRTSDKTFLRTRTVEVLAQCLDDMSRHPQLQPVTLPLEDAPGIYHVRNLLLEQYEQNWTMKKLSEKTGLNNYKLEMGFQQLYGQSPADYLRDVRMEKAWQLLPGKKYSVAQVADMVGYTNLSAFSKAFKKYHHITARQRSKEKGNEA